MVSEGAMIPQVAAAETAFSVINIGTSKGVVNPAAGAAAPALNAGLGSL